MDASAFGEQPLPALAASRARALCWGGDGCANEVAQALSLILPLLPPDALACATCVCRAWRTATAHPALWEELSFERCTAQVNDAALASLCARAGAALRTLRLDARTCLDVSGYELVDALREGGCAGVRHIWAQPNGEDRSSHALLLSPHAVRQLTAACPLLEHAACAVTCVTVMEAVNVAEALPGPLKLVVQREGAERGTEERCRVLRCNVIELVAQSKIIAFGGEAAFFEALQVNTTLTSLRLVNNVIGPTGAAALAEALRVNSTLTSLRLELDTLLDEGAAALADALRTNATLTTLEVGLDVIGRAGWIALADMLRANATLTSVRFVSNRMECDEAVAFAEALHVNTTLTALDLGHNRIGDEGAMAFGDALRVNATLKSLVLRENSIGNAGALALAEALRMNSTLTLLDLQSRVFQSMVRPLAAAVLRDDVSLRGRLLV